VRRKMRLKLIVHLVRKETMEREFERLPYEPLYEDILDVPVLKGFAPDDEAEERNIERPAEDAAPFSALRQASVAISRARVTPRLRILSRQIRKTSMARPIAGSPSRPDDVMPSPSRMIRENASMTRKPSWVARATRSRQLLVPRSSAA